MHQDAYILTGYLKAYIAFSGPFHLIRCCINIVSTGKYGKDLRYPNIQGKYGQLYSFIKKVYNNDETIRMKLEAVFSVSVEL